MTVWAGYLYPLPELYQQSLTTSLSSTSLPRFTGYQLTELDGLTLIGTRTFHQTTWVTRSLGAAFILPTYADDLLNHFLVIPSVLALGNLLSSQQRTIEIANLFTGSKQISAVLNQAGTGISFPGLSALPAIIIPYNSFILSIAISTSGNPTIKGTIEIDGADVGGANPQALIIPITGQRITLFPWDPEQFYTEVLQWKTDIIESYNGTEQRIGVRLNPRQVLTYEIFARDPVKDAAMRLVLFNWLPRVWGVPIWWEQRGMTAAASPGNLTINVSTASADFRVGGLVFIQNPAGQYETFEIASFTSSAITVTSNLLNSYPIGSKVMPVRTAVAKTQTQSSVYLTGAEKMTVQFTTLDNIGLADISTWTQYLGLPVLDDINYVESTLSEGMSRTGVTIIDNASGTIYQQSSSDRSRPTSVKTWWTIRQLEIWRLRGLLHWMHGNQNTFWLPTNRNDLQLLLPISSGSQSFTASFVGYSLYGLDINGNPMTPFGHLRFTLTNGTKVLRRITGCVSTSGTTETFTVDSAINGTTLTVAQVARIEFLQLMRIADDKATLTHDHPGNASVAINVIGVPS